MYLKYWISLVLIGLGTTLPAQQHLNNSWSISGGKLMNVKGGNIAIHYHLNSFNELRLGFYKHQQLQSDSTATNATLTTKLLSLDYVLGFKLKKDSFSGMGFYVGIGSVFGSEKIIGDATVNQSIFGFSIFSEVEYAPIAWLSIYARYRPLILLNQHQSKNTRGVIGARIYF